jgi:hypothetical protein
LYKHRAQARTPLQQCSAELHSAVAVRATAAAAARRDSAVLHRVSTLLFSNVVNATTAATSVLLSELSKHLQHSVVLDV